MVAVRSRVGLPVSAGRVPDGFAFSPGFEAAVVAYSHNPAAGCPGGPPGDIVSRRYSIAHIPGNNGFLAFFIKARTRRHRC